MTTPNSARYAGPFQGNGSTTVRTFSFPVLNKSVVKVVRAVLNADTGVYEWGAPLTEGVDYTIDLTAIPDGQTAYPGGTVTMTTAAADDEQDGIYSAEPGDNTAFNLEGQGPFAASAFNALADHVARAWLDMDRRLTQGANQSPFGTDPVIPDPTGQDDGLVPATLDGVYVLAAFQSFADWLITNVAAGRIIIGAGSDSMTATERFKFLLASYTLYIKASATASDKAVHIVDSDDNDILTFRADGVETADTDIARKAYVDDLFATLSVMGALITGFSAGAGTVANGDTLIQAINKICGNIDLKLATDQYVLSRSSAPITVGNTAVETTIATLSVPAGALSTNKRIRLTLRGKCSTDGTHEVFIRLKYGGTTLATINNTFASSASTDAPLMIEADLMNVNDAAVQFGTIEWRRFAAIAGTLSEQGGASGGATENSATALALTVTWEWQDADTSETITIEHSDAVLY